MKRTTATMIDVFITVILRLLTLHLLGLLWINRVAQDFVKDFQAAFGADATMTSDPDRIAFVVHHALFYSTIIAWIIIIFIGALYHALLNSSSWQATVGKRLFKIMIVNDSNQSKISFKKALSHYFLSILPMIYVFYIIIFQVSHKMTLFHAIIANPINIFFGIIFMLWIQIQIFNKKRATIYDMICNTIFINGRTDFKFPILEFQLKKLAKKID